MKQSTLEKRFEQAKKTAKIEIEKQIAIAMAALNEAQKISEKHGTPFYARVSPLSQWYRPSSFDDKWHDLLNNKDDWDLEIPEFEGWQHSAVC